MRYLVSVLLAATAFAAPASATIALTTTSATVGLNDAGSSFIVNYDGRSGSPVSIIGGLNATATFGLSSVSSNGKAWTFSYAIDNVSTAPVTMSRISVFGFNVNQALLSGSATGLFNGGTGSGNVPNAQPDVGICFLSGSKSSGVVKGGNGKGGKGNGGGNGGGGNCAGGGGEGIRPADAAATGSFTLNFANGQSSIALSNFYARYQSLDVRGNSATSATGLGTVFVPAAVGAVPEPATWGMMILGFGMVGAGMRRRKVAAIVA